MVKNKKQKTLPKKIKQGLQVNAAMQYPSLLRVTFRILFSVVIDESTLHNMFWHYDNIQACDFSSIARYDRHYL